MAYLLSDEAQYIIGVANKIEGPSLRPGLRTWCVAT
jgi:hypothetical protein